MPATKLYDLAVKTGSYTDRQTGAEKGRYQNVGSILQMDDGSKMILLSRTFNPAGVPFKDGSDQIIVSMFKPKEVTGGYAEATSAPAPRQAPRPAPAPANAAPAFDDDIPF
jgi:hypothetical protein